MATMNSLNIELADAVDDIGITRISIANSTGPGDHSGFSVNGI
jgi:hypothetical protein